MNFNDVELLNRSMEGLGDTFRQNRLDRERRQKEIKDEAIRREMAQASSNRQERGLTIEETRLELEKNRGQSETDRNARLDKAMADRESREQSGELDVHLKSANGGSFHYKGPKGGYDKFVDEMQKNGQPVTPSDEPLPKSQLGTYTFETDEGTISFPIESLEQLNTITAKVKELKGRKPQKGTTPTGFRRTEVKPNLNAMGEPTGGYSTNTVTQTPLSDTAAPAAPPTQPQAPYRAGGGMPQFMKVRVISSAGVPGFVPVHQVEQAQKEGYTLAPK